MRGVTVINLVLGTILCIILLIIGIYLIKYILRTPQENLFKVLKEIEEDNDFHSADYIEDTLEAGSYKIRFYKPHIAKTVKEVSEGEKTYSINNCEINYSFLNMYDKNISSILDGTATIYSNINYGDFEISDRFVRYNIGKNVFYKTAITPDGKIVLDGIVPDGYGLTMQILNGKYITKEQLQGFLNFKLY